MFLKALVIGEKNDLCSVAVITTTGGGIVCQLLLSRFTRVLLHPHNPEREMLLLNPFSRW